MPAMLTAALRIEETRGGQRGLENMLLFYLFKTPSKHRKHDAFGVVFLQNISKSYILGVEQFYLLVYPDFEINDFLNILSVG